MTIMTMWKKEEPVAGAMPPRKPSGEKKEQMSAVVLTQCVLGALVLGAALLLRVLLPDAFAVFAADYIDYLGKGAPTTSSNEIFRFASAGVQRAQDALASFAESLEGKPLAAGGQYEITHASYLKTVTTAPYFLSDRAALPVEGTVTSAFGYRTHPITGKEDFHTGIDLAAPKGTPIQAAFGGFVAERGKDAINGNYVKIVHSGSVATAYCHLDTIGVALGQRLRRGEAVGTVGETGMATGPHLHFELCIDGVRVNPAPALGL